MRSCKMGRLPLAFPLQLFSDKCGFSFSRKADMKFLLKSQAQKTGWKNHSCCHRLMWKIVFPQTHGRDATNPFPSSFPLLLSQVRAFLYPQLHMILSPVVPWSLGRASLSQLSSESEMWFHLPYSKKLEVIES